jgi:uncharacterized protein YjiS (DUF1127 family)
MNATLQFRPAQFRPVMSALSASRLVQAYTRLKRSRAAARARRTLTQVDARTLRDIGITRRQIAVLTITTCAR